MVDVVIWAGWLLLGVAAGLDGASFGQFMISRPVVAATLAGAWGGAPQAGALVGLLLEAFHLRVLPIGAARYPESGPAAVVAGAAIALWPPGLPALVAAVLVGLAWEAVGGWSVHRFRLANIRRASFPAADRLPPERVERAHRACLRVDAMRAATLTLAGLALVALAAAVGLPRWGWDVRLTGAAVATTLVFGPRWRSFVVGMLAGCAWWLGQTAWNAMR